MNKVEEGSLVRWNGRTNPQVVTEVTDAWFGVRSHSDSHYRFYFHDQYLINQQSDTEYDIDEFELLGEVYDVDDW
ncbi:hypothetical protein HZS55_05175 [Halosimplex rubrum]|uniref:Uncharacterized protein n=1 Tax=Halosimplex rubrum TaxID=869889 RepID=A0A7D5SWQ2_9EURY|nr:hypothetical protein [Halosimplex rubrum]QLH76731.1 hypothetical protein HZS55_05175 [Halosimplex rubrum]